MHCIQFWYTHMVILILIIILYKFKKSQEPDLCAELSRVKSDNEFLLMLNRGSEGEIVDLQQKLADSDKFMNDASKHLGPYS